MIQIFYIAIGGALGAVARFELSRYVDSRVVNYINKNMPVSVNAHPSLLLPWGTFLINLVGALLIGLFYVLIVEKQLLNSDLRYLVIIGLLGGFTTYSSFSLENFRLLEAGHIWVASSYMLGTTLFCVLGVWLGVYLARVLL